MCLYIMFQCIISAGTTFLVRTTSQYGAFHCPAFSLGKLPKRALYFLPFQCIFYQGRSGHEVEMLLFLKALCILAIRVNITLLCNYNDKTCRNFFAFFS